MINLKDVNIILTGATGGIGNSIINKLYENEANLLATGTRIEKLEELEWLISQDFPMPDGLSPERGEYEDFLKYQKIFEEKRYGIEIIAIDGDEYIVNTAIIPLEGEELPSELMKKVQGGIPLSTVKEKEEEEKMNMAPIISVIISLIVIILIYAYYF